MVCDGRCLLWTYHNPVYSPLPSASLVEQGHHSSDRACSEEGGGRCVRGGREGGREGEREVGEGRKGKRRIYNTNRKEQRKERCVHVHVSMHNMH